MTTRKDEARAMIWYQFDRGPLAWHSEVDKAIDAYGAACAEEAQTKAAQYLRELCEIGRAIGIIYESDYVCSPAPVERVVEEIRGLLAAERKREESNQQTCPVTVPSGECVCGHSFSEHKTHVICCTACDCMAYEGDGPDQTPHIARHLGAAVRTQPKREETEG